MEGSNAEVRESSKGVVLDPRGLQGLPTKDVKCSRCSAVYVVAESERKPIKCLSCSAILDTDPWRKIMRALT